ncbi:EXPH5 protein, partial [Pycnonotus jocosus]|nr:EXPH5 protein [Pycnonotus jocosus]
QAEMCNSPMSTETSGHSFDTNQNETVEKNTLEWNEQLEKEIFSVLSDLDDQLAQEQTQDPLDRTAFTSSASNVQSSSAFPTSKRQTASRGQHRNDWSDVPSTFFPDGLRTLRAKDEHKIFIRPRNLYPPSVTQNSGFRHKACMNRDTAGRSYSVCSLRRCPSSVSSDQLSASSLQHPLARESKNGFVPRFGRQNPKRIPLSSIVWNNTPDSSEQTPETMFRTQSLMEFHATDHGRYPSSLQETKKYPNYHSKHHYRRSISSSNCFSRISSPDKATSPLSFDNWENYPLYKSENNLSRSYYRDTASHSKLYANQKNSYGRKDGYPSWADIPQCYSDEVFLSPDASFEAFMANLNDHQSAYTKNANTLVTKDCNGQFTTNSPQNGNSENIYMHSFDGDPNTSENSLSYFCLEKGTEKMRSTSPCIRRFHKQDSSPRHTSSCSITGSPGRNSSKSSDPLVIYYTLPRKSASIAGSIMSETPISLPRESKTTYNCLRDNSEDADLPCPKENAQSPRIQNKKNEGHNDGNAASLEVNMSLDSLISVDSHQPFLELDNENQNHITTRNKNSQTPDIGLERKSQPITPSATTSYPLDEEKGRATSHACTPPLPLLTDKNSNTYVNSCLQADTCPEQNLTSQTVLGQHQNTSQPTSLENANLNSYRLRKSHAKSQRERHLSEGICARDSLETSASGSNILPKDGIHGKRFKSYSELLSCDENENWASDNEKCYSTRNLMYPSVEFGIFGKEQQLAFLENIKRSLTEGRLWRPCLLNNPGAFRDTESSSINRAELLSSSSAGSRMSSAASSPRELTDTYAEDPAAYSDSDSDTTTDDEYYLDEIDKESEL